MYQHNIHQHNIHQDNIHSHNIHQHSIHQDNIHQHRIHQDNIHQHNIHQDNIHIKPQHKIHYPHNIHSQNINQHNIHSHNIHDSQNVFIKPQHNIHTHNIHQHNIHQHNIHIKPQHKIHYPHNIHSNNIHQDNILIQPQHKIHHSHNTHDTQNIFIKPQHNIHSHNMHQHNIHQHNIHSRNIQQHNIHIKPQHNIQYSDKTQHYMYSNNLQNSHYNQHYNPSYDTHNPHYNPHYKPHYGPHNNPHYGPHNNPHYGPHNNPHYGAHNDIKLRPIFQQQTYHLVNLTLKRLRMERGVLVYDLEKEMKVTEVILTLASTHHHIASNNIFLVLQNSHQTHSFITCSQNNKNLNSNSHNNNNPFYLSMPCQQPILTTQLIFKRIPGDQLISSITNLQVVVLVPASLPAHSTYVKPSIVNVKLLTFSPNVWQIRFSHPLTVTRIVITSALPSTSQTSMTHFDIFITNHRYKDLSGHRPHQLCATNHQVFPQGATKSFSCQPHPIKGTFLLIKDIEKVFKPYDILRVDVYALESASKLTANMLKRDFERHGVPILGFPGYEPGYHEIGGIQDGGKCIDKTLVARMEICLANLWNYLTSVASK